MKYGQLEIQGRELNPTLKYLGSFVGEMTLGRLLKEK